MDRDVRSVLRTSAYGALAGTALGVVSLPATKSVRGVFIGTSLGLYLGIAIGIYHITHRDDPGNPLNRGRRGGWEPTGEAASGMAAATSPETRKVGPELIEAPEFEASITLLRF